MTDLTFRQRLANHLHQLNLGDTHIAYDLDEFEREIREQKLAEDAEQRAMSSLTGAAALRSASLQAYEGIATHGMPDETRQQVSAWLSRLASEVEGRARTAAIRTSQKG